MKNKKIHICLNLINDKNWHAGNIYIFNMVYALAMLPQAERESIKLSIATQSKKDIPEDIRAKLDAIYIDTLPVLIWYKLLKIVPAFFRFSIFNIRKIDFYYPASNLPKKWIFNWAGWIPDFQFKHLPHLFSKEERIDREKRNVYLSENASLIAFSSEHAMNDYKQFHPTYNNTPFLLRFVSKANEDWLKEDALLTQQKFNLPDQFFIVCNQFWKHKDHHTVIKAISILKQKGITINVVCTGATEDFRNPDYFPSLMEQARQLGIEQQFIVLGFISRHDQIQLIRRSLAIIQPSLFEGWSTVVEDGRSLGKYIFLSDFPVHLEQNPSNTYFFTQQNPEQLATLIQTHLHELQPGPQIEAEQKAFKENQELMNTFGKRIIEMVLFTEQAQSAKA